MTSYTPLSLGPISSSEAGIPFTVVVPAFNAARTLASCMASVLTQTFGDLELVVVDDGSTDATRALATGVEDGRVRVIHQPNRGLPAARNAGTAVARGRVTCYLDSDDLLLPTYLETVKRAFASDPGVDFVYTDTWTLDDRTRRIRRTTTAHYGHQPRPGPATAVELFRELLKRNFMIVPVGVRTEAITALGMFDESLTAAEDWEMWLRLAAAGHRAANALGPLGLRRAHPGQMSSDESNMLENHVRIFEKILTEFRLSPDERTLTEERLEWTRGELEIVRGADPLRSPIRQGRNRLALARRRWGLDFAWYKIPPAAVASAFPDLTKV
ncbi:MAG: glycosyltransferase [Actinomycetota bacterium]|nr:glycosyltransferase [Actinomycetota bacterium]